MKHIKTGLVIVICLLIFGCLFFFLGTALFKFWGPVLSVIPKLPNSFGDMVVRCTVVLALTTLLCYLAGMLFSNKIRKSIPILKEMEELNQRPFVLVKDYPSPGHQVMGIITGKQKFITDCKTNKSEVRPRVYIPYPSNPVSGFLIFPEKEKLQLTNCSASSMIQMVVSMGILGPGTIFFENNGPELNSYYV
jgi:uncharacterized membrane protein